MGHSLSQTSLFSFRLRPRASLSSFRDSRRFQIIIVSLWKNSRFKRKKRAEEETFIVVVVVQNNSPLLLLLLEQEEEKENVTTILLPAMNDDVEATPLLSNNTKHIKRRRGNVLTSFEKGRRLFLALILITVAAALVMTMTTTRTKMSGGLSALKRLGGGQQMQQVKTGVPDEDELTKREGKD